MALIELRNISKIYDLGEVKVSALVDANLIIEKGEYVALVGPSGSGKSTLMNTLGCLDRPTSGSYLLAGEEIATMESNERARIRNQRIGFVFQNFNLVAVLDALENVALPLQIRGAPQRQARDAANQRLREAMTQAARDGDHQWAMELADVLTTLQLHVAEANAVKRSALRALADAQMNAPARNYYLSSAKELG